MIGFAQRIQRLDVLTRGRLLLGALRQGHDVFRGGLDGERRKALRAPVIVAVAAAARPHPKVPEIEQVAAVSAGIENLILAAHALGFGTMWKTGGAAYSAVVKRALGLDEADQILGFVYLGTAVTRAPVRSAEIDAVTRWL